MTLTIRVTPGEKAAILRKAKQAGLSLTDYLVTAAQSTQIFVAEDLKPALTEMKRIGNNLNQITAKINVGAFKSYNFSEVIEWQLKAELGIAKREILKRIEVMEKQGGSSREKFFSDLSEMQSSALKEMREEYDRQSKKSKRYLWMTILASAVLSALVCGGFLFLAA